MGLFSRNFEKRALDMSPRPGRSIFGGFGRMSKAGSMVSSDSVMGIPAIWKAVNFWSIVLASLPCPLLEKVEGGSRKATNHRASKIFSGRVNNRQVPMVFRAGQIASIWLSGMSYSEIVTGNGGQISLWPIPTHRVRPEVDKETGSIIYHIDGAGTLKQSEMLEIEGFSGGKGIIHILHESLGLSLSLNEFAATYFGNGIMPGAVVEHPATLTPDTHVKLSNALSDKHAGLGQAHRFMLLDEGMKLTQSSFDPTKSQVLESRGFAIQDIARIMMLPNHILGDLGKSNFNNMSEQGLELVKYSLAPMATRIEQHYNASLLKDSEQGKFYFRHNFKKLLEGTPKDRSDFYWKLFQMGAINSNQIRAFEEMNGVGKDGDQYFVQGNFLELGKAGTPQIQQQAGQKSLRSFRADEDDEQTDDEKLAGIEKTQKANRENLELVFQGIANKESAAIKKIIKKSTTDGELDKELFLKDLAVFLNDHRAYVEDKYSPAFKLYATQLIDKAADVVNADTDSLDMDEYVTGYVGRFATEYTESSLNQLNRLTEDNEPELAPGILTARCDEWKEKRAEKTMSAEIVNGAGVIARQVWVLSGIKTLRWVARGKSCKLCNQLDGKIIEIEKNFIKTGDIFEAEGQETLVVKKSKRHPQLHKGCDCGILPG